MTEQSSSFLLFIFFSGDGRDMIGVSFFGQEKPLYRPQSPMVAHPPSFGV
jgi:hypothetical protein